MLSKFIGIAILFVVVPAASTNGTGESCGPDLAERVVVPNSPWIIDTQVFSCSAIDPGKLEILAFNKESGEQVILLRVNGVVDSHVEVTQDRRINIVLPNMVDIQLQRFSIGLYPVVYQYLPKDDPEERENYRKWVHNPQDPTIQEWYRKRILERMQPQMASPPKASAGPLSPRSAEAPVTITTYEVGGEMRFEFFGRGNSDPEVKVPVPAIVVGVGGEKRVWSIRSVEAEKQQAVITFGKVPPGYTQQFPAGRVEGLQPGATYCVVAVVALSPIAEAPGAQCFRYKGLQR